jgi:hypothetical protein
MTDLSPIFGSQVPDLPQNHDVVKTWCRKRYKNFWRINNMMQLSLVTITCGQKLTFPCFRRVLILCMLCTDYCNNNIQLSFFPRYDHVCFCTITCSLTNCNLVNLSCWTDIVIN